MTVPAHEQFASTRERPGRLRAVPDRSAVDVEAAEQAVVLLLRALGKDPASPHLTGTPGRVARSFAELLTGRQFDLTTFPNDDGYRELVIVRDIPVQ